jgi:hypothetical protein
MHYWRGVQLYEDIQLPTVEKPQRTQCCLYQNTKICKATPPPPRPFSLYRVKGDDATSMHHKTMTWFRDGVEKWLRVCLRCDGCYLSSCHVLLLTIPKNSFLSVTMCRILLHHILNSHSVDNMWWHLGTWQQSTIYLKYDTRRSVLEMTVDFGTRSLRLSNTEHQLQ